MVVPLDAVARTTSMRTKTVHKGKSGANVTPAKYNAMRDAMLSILPGEEPGLTWDEMVQAIAPKLPQELFPHLGSVRWYSKAVQLDLEARREIERVPGSKPLRFTRLNDGALER